MSLEIHGLISRGDFTKEVSLSIMPGEVLAVLGKNGSGKSTLLHTIAGLLPLASGQLAVDNAMWDDTNTTYRSAESRLCGVVFQDLHLFGHMSVLANVMFGLRSVGVAKAEAKERARVELKRVGLTEFEKRSPRDLSGGERQRVALARAIVMKPRVLLLDEPLAAVDADSRQSLWSELPTVLQQFSGMTILVSHDADDISRLATRSVHLDPK